MIHKKLISTILLLAICLSLLAGCGSAKPQETQAPAETTAATEAATEATTEATEAATEPVSAYPMTVVDQIGREVVIEKPAERIVSSYYISTAALIALGKTEQIVGIEMKANTRNLYKLAAPSMLDLPALGNSKNINVEETAALKPDVVILPKKLKDTVEQFDALGIPVIVVNPESQADFESCLELLGNVTGSSQRAEKLVSYCRDKMAEIQALTASLEHKPKVYLTGSSSYLTTCTAKMYQSEVIGLAGGINVSAELEDSAWATVSAEQLLAWNPDVILPVSYSEYDVEEMKADAAIAEVSAIANGAIYTFPSSIEPWDYPTPSSILGVMWLTHTLHPEVLSEEDYVNEAKAFYQEYFGIEVTNADIGL